MSDYSFVDDRGASSQKLKMASALLSPNCAAFVGAAVLRTDDDNVEYVELGVVSMDLATSNLVRWVSDGSAHFERSTAQVYLLDSEVGTNPMSRALYELRRERALNNPAVLARIAEVVNGG